MSIENNVSKFEQWALRMGCSLEDIPCEKAIKSIYKSRQYQLFSDLINRVQPLEVVEEARKNFVIESKRYSDKKLAIYSPIITRQYDAYMKLQNLKRMQQKEQQALEQQRNEYQSAISVLEMKNAHLNKEYAKKSKLQALKHIYMLKAQKLEDQITQEAKKAVSLANITPLQCAKYAGDELTRKLVKQALDEINDFDATLTEHSGSIEDATAIKLKLWQEMRQIFYSLPNSSIYEHITNLKVQQMQNFSKLIADSGKNVASKGRLNAFEQALLETKIKLTEYIAQYVNARTQRLEYEEDFTEGVEQFVDELKNKMQFVNEDEEQLNELISVFVYQYNLKNMKECQNKVLATQIDALNEAIEQSAKELENHELLLQSVKQTYLNINVCINRMQAEIVRMKNMKPKLLYPKNMFNSMVKGNFLRMVKRNAETIGAQRKNDLIADSFELGGENVFSSTKLDFDTTSSMMVNKNDQTLSFMRNTQGRIVAPTHVSEILLFMETNVDNFKISVNLSPFLCLAAILPSSLSNIKLVGTAASLLFLSPIEALRKLKNDLKWMKVISAEHSPKQKTFYLDVTNEESLKEMQKAQHQELAELLDKTEATLEYLQHLLHTNRNLYEFILKNVLKNYVPPSKTYKNYNFYQYDAEYRNYFSITENFMQ